MSYACTHGGEAFTIQAPRHDAGTQPRPLGAASVHRTRSGHRQAAPKRPGPFMAPRRGPARRSRSSSPKSRRERSTGPRRRSASSSTSGSRRRRRTSDRGPSTRTSAKSRAGSGRCSGQYRSTSSAATLSTPPTGDGWPRVSRQPRSTCTTPSCRQHAARRSSGDGSTPHQRHGPPHQRWSARKWSYRRRTSSQRSSRPLSEIDPVLATAIALAALTGARRGELVALRWSDVDLDGGRVRFARSLTVAGGEQHTGPTKTHASRDIALDDSGVEGAPASMGLTWLTCRREPSRRSSPTLSC